MIDLKFTIHFYLFKMSSFWSTQRPSGGRRAEAPPFPSVPHPVMVRCSCSQLLTAVDALRRQVAELLSRVEALEALEVEDRSILAGHRERSHGVPRSRQTSDDTLVESVEYPMLDGVIPSFRPSTQAV